MQEEFKNIKAVADYLTSQGWKITQRSVYNHAKSGLLGKKKNGVYTLRQVQDYARDWLMTDDANNRIRDEDLNRQKLKIEIAHKMEQTKLAKLNREIAEAKWVLKEDVMFQLAARAAVFEHGLKAAVREAAVTFIKAVDGDIMKVPDFIDIFYTLIDTELNNYATKMVFEVTFVDENETQEDDNEG